MRRGFSVPVVIGAFLALTGGSAFAQDSAGGLLTGYYGVAPWTEGAPQDAMAQSLAGATIPMANFSITATKDGNTYSGVLTGTSPFANPLSGTTLTAVVIPLIIKIGSVTFDPTAPNSCDGNVSAVSRFNSSPLVNATSLTFNGVNVGNFQFNNGFRQAEFWSQTGGSSAYNNAINFSTASAVTLTAGFRGTTAGSACSQLGIVSNSWLDSELRNTVLPALTKSGAISTTKFAIFLLKNVVQSTSIIPNTRTCCILGYHGATGNPVQTYGPMDWDTSGEFGAAVSDSSVATHEIGEWLDDPLGTNPTPAWGGIGQVSGCQSNLEVGDPLSGTLMPPVNLNGYTYHLQELGYFSWFFNAQATPTLGAGGKFSANGTFAGPAKVCPPGGTF